MIGTTVSILAIELLYHGCPSKRGSTKNYWLMCVYTLIIL